jgi:hypothetical protein
MLDRSAVTCALLLLLVACDDKAKTTPGAASASATASAVASAAPAASSAAPTTTATPEATASAASSASMVSGDEKNVMLTVRDPAKEPEKTIKAAAGGTVTVYLPDAAGTVWSVDTSDKALGKPKEQVIPGFAPGASGHEFKFTNGGAKGAKVKATFVNKKAGKPNGTFTLVIDVT